MRHFPIFIATFFLTSTYASPAPPIPNNPPSTNPPLSAPYQCLPLKIFGSTRGKLGDCAHAIAFLPNYHEAGTFYRSPNPSNADPFALPRTEVYKSCQVKIDLKFGRVDVSSWTAINIAAGKVMAACTIGYRDAATTGGETIAGNEDRIVISLGKAESMGGIRDGSGNMTDVATERRAV